MVSASHAHLVQRVVDEIWNAGDLDLADELFGRTYVNHGGLVPDLVCGPESVKFSVALYRMAFPNLHIWADELRASGGMVTLRWTARAGSNNGDGVRTRGDALTGSTKFSVIGDQIVESWTSWNSAAVLEKLGVAPRMG
ncbi:MAG: ester cyclase [Chloroflexi bacterium]|nr:MAG: ester cyclase [Chloroflexota bacterium]